MGGEKVLPSPRCGPAIDLLRPQVPVPAHVDSLWRRSARRRQSWVLKGSSWGLGRHVGVRSDFP